MTRVRDRDELDTLFPMAADQEVDLDSDGMSARTGT